MLATASGQNARTVSHPAGSLCMRNFVTSPQKVRLGTAFQLFVVEMRWQVLIVLEIFKRLLLWQNFCG